MIEAANDDADTTGIPEFSGLGFAARRHKQGTPTTIGCEAEVRGLSGLEANDQKAQIRSAGLREPTRPDVEYPNTTRIAQPAPRGPSGLGRPSAQHLIAGVDSDLASGIARPERASGLSRQVSPAQVNRHRPVAHKRSFLRLLFEVFVLLVTAFIISVMLQAWVVKAYKIPSPSMYPTLKVGDRILVNRLAYRTHPPSRGDIVVFGRPDSSEALDGGEGLPADLVKRVIGLPGDVLEARNGMVFVNGEPLIEPWLPDGVVTGYLPLTVVPLEHVFVMGDNRSNSRDSRFIGAIDVDKIRGRVVAKIWPIQRVVKF